MKPLPPANGVMGRTEIRAPRATRFTEGIAFVIAAPDSPIGVRRHRGIRPSRRHRSGSNY